MKCPKCGGHRAKFEEDRLKDIKKKKANIRRSKRISREQREGWRSRNSAQIKRVKEQRENFNAKCQDCGFVFDAKESGGMIG